jgi:transposase, IS6 family
VAELKAESKLPRGCQLRGVKYLNNVIEQDHRFIKRRVRPGLGFFSFPTAWRTLQGYETMHLIQKGQIEIGGIQEQVKFVDHLIGLATKHRLTLSANNPSPTSHPFLPTGRTF